MKYRKGLEFHENTRLSILHTFFLFHLVLSSLSSHFLTLSLFLFRCLFRYITQPYVHTFSHTHICISVYIIKLPNLFLILSNIYILFDHVTRKKSWSMKLHTGCCFPYDDFCFLLFLSRVSFSFMGIDLSNELIIFCFLFVCFFFFYIYYVLTTRRTLLLLLQVVAVVTLACCIYY